MRTEFQVIASKQFSFCEHRQVARIKNLQSPNKLVGPGFRDGQSKLDYFEILCTKKAKVKKLF